MVKTYVNKRQAIQKDEVMAELVPYEISQCSLVAAGETACSSEKTIWDIADAIGVSGTDLSAIEILTIAKKKLGCGDEKCVLQKLASKLGPQRVNDELQANFKPEGPTDNKLLSNIHIDAILKQFQVKFPELFAYNFNMRNYASYSYDNGHILDRPDSLATISFIDLYNRSYRMAACVINSDVYQGDGKHWMALFADARGPRWTVEFFNSSGNAPAPEWVNWMVKTKNAMDAHTGTRAEIIKATGLRHQHSKTECGVYSIFYIWARCNGVPPEYFLENPVPDQLMFEFRHHLFSDPKRGIGVARFDWDAYKKEIRLTWE